MSSSPEESFIFFAQTWCSSTSNNNKEAKSVVQKGAFGMWQAADHGCQLPAQAAQAGAMTARAPPTGWWREQALRLSRQAPAFLASSEADVANRRGTAAGQKGVSSSNTPSGHTAACGIRKRKRDINHDCCIVPRSGAAAPRQSPLACPRVGKGRHCGRHWKDCILATRVGPSYIGLCCAVAPITAYQPKTLETWKPGPLRERVCDSAQVP